MEGLKDKSLEELYDINNVQVGPPMIYIFITTLISCMQGGMGVTMGISGMYCEQVSANVYFAMVATASRYYPFALLF